MNARHLGEGQKAALITSINTTAAAISATVTSVVSQNSDILRCVVFCNICYYESS